MRGKKVKRTDTVTHRLSMTCGEFFLTGASVDGKRIDQVSLQRTDEEYFNSSFPIRWVSDLRALKVLIDAYLEEVDNESKS